MADTGAIAAQIVDIRNNQPIPNAAVKLSGPVDQQAKTGEDGKFKFSNLPPANNYALNVSVSGYQSEYYEDIVVLADVTTNLFKLFLFPNEQ